MISLVLSNSHLLCGQWSTGKDSPILTSLTLVELTHALNDLINKKSEINSVINIAIKQLSEKHNFEDMPVEISIEDNLFYHERFKGESLLSKSEVWDYIKWEAKQKWGKFGDNFITYCEVYKEKPDQYHTISCNSRILESLKDEVISMGGQLQWLGPDSTLLLGPYFEIEKVFVLDEGSFYRVFHRSDGGFNHGRIRFLASGIKFTEVVGNKDVLETVFNTEKERKSFFMLEPISEKRQSHWENYNTIELIPFEKINIEGIEIHKNINVRYLNILTAMINRDPELKILNLMNPPGIFELTVEERKLKDKHLQDGPSLEEGSSDEKKISPSTKIKRKKGWKYLFIIILVLGFGLILLDSPASYLQYINEIGKRSQLSTENQFLAKSLIDSLSSQSNAIIAALYNILPADAYNDLMSLTIQGLNADYGIASSDSSFVTSITAGNIKSFEMADIECCGGILSSVSTTLAISQPDSGNMGGPITTLEFESYLNSDLPTVNYTKPDEDKSTNYFYDPYILQMDNENDLRSFLESEKDMGNNLVVRKVSFDRNLESGSIEILIYLMLLVTTN
ncbi:MAG: hypothetical protein V3U16_04770 [Candidatus Neomarinimicrobiota bacterium]